MNLSLERIIQAGVALALAALIGIGVLALRDARATTASAEWSARTIQMREHLNLAADLASDAESGALGFSLTPDTAYAALFRASSAHTLTIVDQLRTLSEGNADQHRRTDSLAAMTTREFALLHHLMDLRGSPGAARTMETVARDELAAMNEIRALVARMNSDETRRHNDAAALLEDQRRRAEFDVWAGMVIAVALAAIGGIVIGRELKRRRQAEAEVGEHYRKLTELGDLLDHAHVMLRGLDGTIRLWTSGAEEVYGWSKAEAIGQVSHELLRTEFPAPLSEINRELESTGHWDGFLRHHKRDGSVVVKHSQWLLHRDADGETSVLEINRDVTEQKRAEELVRVSEAELKRSNEDLERFAYVASHDLQEPLRMVASYVQLLGKRYKGKLDADADEFIGYASDGAVRMQRLIEDLLAFSRIGTRGTAMQKTDINAVLAGALANLKLAIDESGSTVSSGKLPTVDGDAGQLGHLFQNLLSNALKFRRDDPPLIDIFAERHDKEWLFSVHDNGIGIEPQYFERIFVIFQRLHGREKYSGNGIGLSIARKIAERHGGRMWVESERGRGTTFFFTLPVGKEV